MSEPQSGHLLQRGSRKELDGQMHGTYQLEGRQLDELDGTQVGRFTSQRE